MGHLTIALHIIVYVCILFPCLSFSSSFLNCALSSAKQSLSIMWQAGMQAPAVCVYTGSAWKWISPHWSHLSYQSVNVLPRWWRNTFTTVKSRKIVESISSRALHRPHSTLHTVVTSEEKKLRPVRDMRAPKFSPLPRCTFFKLAECVCWGWPRRSI